MPKPFQPRRLYGFVALLLPVGFLGLFLNSRGSDNPGENTSPPPPDTAVTITLGFVGDLMCHEHQFKYAQTGPNTYNFKPSFERVKAALSAPDLMVGNLETTLTGSQAVFSGYPMFNSPDEYLDAIVDAGFDFIVTSNNHSLDKGDAGIIRTIQKLDEAKIPHTGTYLSQQDRDSVRVVDVKGIKIAFLNYTYGTNGMPFPAGKPWACNLIDTALVRKDIAAARLTDAELVLVFLHYGNEYERLPGAYQKMVVNHSISCGADLIIGSHPHVIQPMEYYKTQGGRLDTGFVAWSLGNFISNQYDRYKDAGIILNLQLTKDLRSGKIRISDSNFLSTWVYRGTNPVKKIHQIFPAAMAETDTLPSFLTADLVAKMKQAAADTRAHVKSTCAALREKKITEFAPVDLPAGN